MKRIGLACLGALFVFGVAAPALATPAREKLTEERMLEAFGVIAALAVEAVELRNNRDEMEFLDYVKAVDSVRGGFDEVMVLIATTSPPKKLQQAAIHAAVGVKEIELSLWYTLLGLLENNADYMDYADRLLVQGVTRLGEAEVHSGE